MAPGRLCFTLGALVGGEGSAVTQSLLLLFLFCISFESREDISVISSPTQLKYVWIKMMATDDATVMK